MHLLKSLQPYVAFYFLDQFKNRRQMNVDLPRIQPTLKEMPMTNFKNNLMEDIGKPQTQLPFLMQKVYKEVNKYRLINYYKLLEKTIDNPNCVDV